MSVKRQATSELNHDNWDQEEPPESNEMGTFKTASRDILEKRVIRTAKRRAPISSNESKKSVFLNTRLGDSSKPIPSSFDFLANLTNHNKSANGSTGETSLSSSIFGSKTAGSSSGVFGSNTATAEIHSTSATPVTSTPIGTSGKLLSSTFTTSKVDSTVNETPFKMQSVFKTADSNSTKVTASFTPKITSNMFNAPLTSTNNSKLLLASTTSTPLKPLTVSSITTTTVQTTFSSSTNTAVPPIAEKTDVDQPNEKKLRYYAKLKGLNESVSSWISEHVLKTPLCILSPIFKDYEKYLKEILSEYQEPDETGSKEIKNEASEKNIERKSETITSTLFGKDKKESSVDTAANAATAKSPTLGAKSIVSTTENNPKFSFGIITSPNNTSNTTTTSTGFSFGVTSTANMTSSPFSLTTSNPTTQNSSPFSFGVGKPFSFSPSNVQKNSDTSDKETTEEPKDEPPKVEYTPVKEDNSVFEAQCKLFFKKDGNFVDKGVGTLYIKEIKESGKNQLLVRNNTNLGTIMINLVLSSTVPMQRVGKNNVMLVCFPTPDAKPPPTPVLIRVKTAEAADQLLETLKKYTV